MTKCVSPPLGTPGACQNEGAYEENLGCCHRSYLSAGYRRMQQQQQSTSSSSTSSSSTSSSAGATATAGSGSANGADIAAAKAYQDQFLSSPTSIGISTPLNSKPAPGKLLVGLDSGLGSATVLAKYWAQAAADARLEVQEPDLGGNADSAAGRHELGHPAEPGRHRHQRYPDSHDKYAARPREAEGYLGQHQRIDGLAASAPCSTPRSRTPLSSPSGARWSPRTWSCSRTARPSSRTSRCRSSRSSWISIRPSSAAIKQWCPDCKVTQNPQHGRRHRHDHSAGRGLCGHPEPEHQLADLRPR